MGCPHYARACKLRHPDTGQLFTCRLCCQELRETPITNPSVALPMSSTIPALDRYAVTEVLCMRCGSLQPTGPRCINPQCGSEASSISNTSGLPFAKYFCPMCNLFDDESKSIYHCPFCNVCRIGKGLGIDFRHCMVRKRFLFLRFSMHNLDYNNLDSYPCIFSNAMPVLPCQIMNSTHVYRKSCKDIAPFVMKHSLNRRRLSEEWDVAMLCI